MITLLLAFILKATLWTAGICAAVLAVSAQHAQSRRRLAAIGMWGVWIVPLLRLPASQSSFGVMPLSEVVTTQSMSWLAVLAALWLLGSLVLVLRLLCEAAGIARIVRNAAARRCHACAPLEVRFSHEIEGPCLTGWWRPCVLLPLEAAAWPEATLQAALRHECQRARQHDGLHRACAALLRALFWWNPAVHALCCVYEQEAEVCCDLAASATGVSRRDYGQMLLAHATSLPQRGLAVPFARRSGLRGRIERLLASPSHTCAMLATRWLLALSFIAAASWLMATIRIEPTNVSAESTMEQEARLRLNADPFPGRP